MTALMMYRPWNTQTVRRSSVVRQRTVWAGIIDAASAALRPLAVAAGLIAAAAAFPAVAQADSPNGSAGVAAGQSICPMLVQPGATLASIASQLTGSTGLSPGMARFVATLAIQTQCPSFMQSLANGQMPSQLQALGGHTLPSIPLMTPGASTVPPR
ncbi:DUF732 domain-containing protein [Mycobacterium sp. 1081908.1]|uniref:DUF732 domain-containing protein n=1 Tax=Mycobacterium sp. 1081908.1 TaxID=1834066 RepID=UPI0012EA0A7B|nr:DUF732 domain-containing protein [Mycobacterium sp. 1081908.1]